MRERTSPLPEDAQKARAVRAMFDGIARRYDLVNRIMTFGLDVGWRKRATHSLGLPAGALVLDLACGTGDFCRELSAAGMHPTGFDFSYGMLAAARTSAALAQADILRLPVADARADGITCGFALRNVVDLAALFAEMARVLRPGGRIALLEVSEPRSTLLRAGHAFYFNKVVPLIGGAISDRQAYRYLPASVAYLPPPEELLGMLRDSGFADASRIPLAAGAAQLIIGTRA
ncbi:MAG: ubiquinone/menaquinone biosynthesis methyltransferase [Actinomycetota bacterium]